MGVDKLLRSLEVGEIEEPQWLNAILKATLCNSSWAARSPVVERMR